MAGTWSTPKPAIDAAGETPASTFDRDKYHRRSIRLQRYDYTQAGVYFVTICTHRHILRFGDVVDRQMRLNAVGLMIAEHGSALPQRFTHVSLDQFVVMPNHLHAILIVARTESDARVGPPLVGVPVRAGTRPAPTGACDAPDENVGTSVVGAPGVPPSLSDIIGAFKSLTTVEYSRRITSDGWRKFRTRLWQRNYFEHIVRDEESLNRIRQYILDNPARWAFDREPAPSIPTQRTRGHRFNRIDV